MQLLLGDQRICGMTIDSFCFYSRNDPDYKLSEQEKLKIVSERAEELNSKEWQRWTPFLGFYRMIKDCVTSDNILLTEMHSTKYTVTNIAYNVATTIAGTAGLLSLLN